MPRVTCPACNRPSAYCYCAQIREVTNSWPVFILQDVREASHPIGTARMVTLSLTQAEMVTLDPDQPDTTESFLNRIFSRPLLDPALIYPGSHAQTIDALHNDESRTNGPRDLLFIDASWGRSLRLLNVFPTLASLPCFALTGLPASRYRIRKQPAADAVSTLEAVVHTLQQVEPALDCTPMLTAMDWVIEQQIKRMGSDTYYNNYLSK